NNVTITNNKSTAGRGGGVVFGSNDVVRNSLIAGNTNVSGSSNDCFNGGVATSQRYNLLGNNDGCGLAAKTGDVFGTAASPINPQLGPLAANSGKTAGSPGNLLTIPTHALLSNSPALDAGNRDTPGRL